ncbi:hypothetical protein A1F94_011548 [Pyrenophora tritici-repentis]|uniref:Uncharacterized protein n=2 Tax=Pyrenophora tritici-repentis TaxID=45151 RepID=A0A2W1E3N9_9PLEO|nr:uncharacterized protein PTRG_09245 [Pyrenophora tritici-repentis Pt-1C-BFP]KAF7442108.1 hypothetical protein A1F99_129770 [Pyrenophora tritici-repentis]EDU42296.1 predicted protein [Pyrenophora tritici-repentis Pt-1C-BFP]KAF7579529.1 hypothetical protein PtrM4_037690 [Pyrenophora tritici-repentis]KAG9378432.1 hypothetical protein A1F94_011548 [Pyrenophora tritici-repentis]KAI0573011.1 hypothetical protein Alg215_09439 [Pyrenophora tritici-repentis]
MNSLDLLLEFAVQQSNASEIAGSDVKNEDKSHISNPDCYTEAWGFKATAAQPGIYNPTYPSNNASSTRTIQHSTSMPPTHPQQQHATVPTMQTTSSQSGSQSTYETPLHTPRYHNADISQLSYQNSPQQHFTSDYNNNVYDPMLEQQYHCPSQDPPWTGYYSNDMTMSPADMMPWGLYKTSSCTPEDARQHEILDMFRGQELGIGQGHHLEGMCGCGQIHAGT